MANINIIMDLKKIKQTYRNKFIILCQPGDSQTSNKYLKYCIIDIINQPAEKNLIFVLKDKENQFRKIVLNRETLHFGKGEIRINEQIYKCRIVNARNFPIVDSSYFSLE